MPILICPRCREVSTFVGTSEGRVRCNSCKQELWANTIIVSKVDVVDFEVDD